MALFENRKEVERYCNNCKHADKKITEEPCFICNAWCNKWEAKNDSITDTSSNIDGRI